MHQRFVERRSGTGERRIFMNFASSLRTRFMLERYCKSSGRGSGPQKERKPMRTMRTFLAVILVLVGTAGLALSEDGPPPTRMLSPYFFIEGANPGVDSF